MQTNSTKTILSLSVAPKDYLSHTFILFAGRTQIAGKQTGNGEILYQRRQEENLKAFLQKKKGVSRRETKRIS